eukprot:4885220-Pleurochrysis_carterae.AAC.1
MGHGQASTAVCAKKGICEYIPHDPIGCIRSAVFLYEVPVATIMKTVFYIGLRAISGCRSWRP